MRKTIQVHISEIRPGDTVLHDGHERTVCRSDIKSDTFMGVSIFGDSYRAGTKKVTKVIFETGNFYIRNKETGLYFSGWSDTGKAVFGDANHSKPYGSKEGADCQILFLNNCEVE